MTDKKPLTRARNELYHFVDGVCKEGQNKDMTGDCSWLTGNCSWLEGDCSELEGNCSRLTGDCSRLAGDCSELEGNCSGLSGHCSGLRGDLDEIPMKSRGKHPEIAFWVEGD